LSPHLSAEDEADAAKAYDEMEKGKAQGPREAMKERSIINAFRPGNR
jgi:hypothetical protein